MMHRTLLLLLVLPFALAVAPGQDNPKKAEPEKLKLWNGLPDPANVNGVEWQLTLARTALQAGDAEGSATTMKRLLGERPAVSPELARRR